MEEGKRQKRRQRLSLLLEDGMNSISLPNQDDLKKRMNRITATWQNGCFKKMDDHPVHTIPNHRPSKMDVLPKNSVQIIIAVTSSIRPPSNSDDLGLLVCIYPSSMAEMLILGLSLSPKAKSK